MVMWTAEKAAAASSALTAQTSRAATRDAFERASELGLLHSDALASMEQLARMYPLRTTPNPGFLNLFPANNLAETFQNRAALAENARRLELTVIDMDGPRPIQWRSPNVLSSKSSFVLALDPRQLDRADVSFMLVCVSNTHVLNDYLSLGMVERLADKGVAVVGLEYPGYGASLGVPSRAAWTRAAASALLYLHRLTHTKPFVFGHSIGGAVAFEAARSTHDHLAGVVSFGSFFSLLEMAADQARYGLGVLDRAFNAALAFMTIGGDLFECRSGLQMLAASGVPGLIMHGAHDHSVPPRHLALFERALRQLNADPRHGRVTTALLDACGHEDVHYARSPNFEPIWQRIVAFTRRAA
jgi:pimeloyl-ACP methyl ester carboxylesterase